MSFEISGRLGVAAQNDAGERLSASGTLESSTSFTPPSLVPDRTSVASVPSYRSDVSAQASRERAFENVTSGASVVGAAATEIAGAPEDSNTEAARCASDRGPPVSGYFSARYVGENAVAAASRNNSVSARPSATRSSLVSRNSVVSTSSLASHISGLSDVFAAHTSEGGEARFDFRGDGGADLGNVPRVSAASAGFGEATPWDERDEREENRHPHVLTARQMFVGRESSVSAISSAARSSGIADHRRLSVESVAAVVKTISKNSADALLEPRKLPWRLVFGLVRTGFALCFLGSFGIFAWLRPVTLWSYAVDTRTLQPHAPKMGEGAAADSAGSESVDREGPPSAGDSVILRQYVWNLWIGFLLPFYAVVIPSTLLSIIGMMYGDLVEALKFRILFSFFVFASVSQVMVLPFVIQVTDMLSRRLALFPVMMGVFFSVWAAAREEERKRCSVVPESPSIVSEARGAIPGAESSLRPVDADHTPTQASRREVRAKAYAKALLPFFVFFLPFPILGLGGWMARIESDIVKFLMVSVGWPCVREAVYFVIREVCRASFEKDNQTRHATYFAFNLFTTMVSRFLIMSISDNAMLIVTAVFQAAQEILLRQTIDARDKFLVMLIAKLRFGGSVEDTRVWYYEGGVTENRAQVILSEMVVEYVGIAVTPLLKLAMSEARFLYDFGYEGGTPVNTDALLVGFWVQFLLELLVDLICCFVEEEHFGLPLLKAWNDLNLRSGVLIFFHAVMGHTVLIIFAQSFVVRISGCSREWLPGDVYQSEYQVCTEDCLATMKSSYYDALCSDQQKMSETPEALLVAKMSDAERRKFIGGKHPIDSSQPVTINTASFRGDVKVLKKLGEGSFGVVHECRIRASGKTVAVKMIDLLEADRAEIENELRLLCTMSHPNIIRCHDIYREECFICIVMDKFGGGDLVDGLQRHLGSKGKIREPPLKPIVRQMLRSIAYLQINSIVHRDVKGDNFLMNTQDITDSTCVVVLADFGTAMKLEKGKQLKELCGTRIFWAPEMCNRKYSFEVDTWAVGVVSYGLLDGTFPFRDERQIKECTPHWPKCSPPCLDMVKKFLKKDPAKRPSALELLKHEWCLEEEKPADKKDVKPFSTRKASDVEMAAAEAMKQDVPAAVVLRRREMQRRLDKKAEAKEEKQEQQALTKKKSEALNALKDFTVDGLKAGEQIAYSWLKPEDLTDVGYIGGGKSSSADSDSGHMNVASLEYQLKKAGVDTSQFGQGAAKTLQQLCAEISKGESLLMQDVTGESELLRVVDVVLLRITYNQKNILVETHEQFEDGRKRETGRLPGTKQRPHESPIVTAERIVTSFLGMRAEDVNFELTNRELITAKEDSPSYPGVKTVYRKRIIPASIVTDDKKALEKLGLVLTKDKVGMREFITTGTKSDKKAWNWLTKEEVNAKKLVIAGDKEEAQFNPLVAANLKVHEDKLVELLEAHKIDVSKFGDGLAASIAEFAAELSHGESSLIEDEKGSLIRVVDIVLLRVMDVDSKKMLVEVSKQKPNGQVVKKRRLPGLKRGPNDNIYGTARQMLTTLMGFEEDWFVLGHHELIEEEKPSESYPCLRTVYRKRFVSVKLLRQA
eukprot:gene235-108_t